MITNRRLFRAGCILSWLFLIGFGLFVQHKTALAESPPSGYTITVSESASSMTYGSLAPNFQASVERASQ